jgi:O-antigen/teichoic acid export membrane protein
MSVSLANLVLRGVTMVGRFALLATIAAYLSPVDVGIFALFSAAILWGVYLQGVEFYLFSLRDIVAGDHNTWARRTRDAFALYGIIFGISAVVWLCLFGVGFMPWRLICWFLAILAFEHAAQESYRLLNVFGRPLRASVVLFARNGIWNYVVVAIFVVSPDSRSLEIVWIGWICGGAMSVLASSLSMKDLPWRGLPAIDWGWLRRGLGIGLPLLAGSLAYRGITLFDRWYVGETQGDVALGIYGFFSSIALAFPTLAESGLGAVIYPKMMRAAQAGEEAEYRRQVRRLMVAFVAFIVATVPVAIVVMQLGAGRLAHGQYASQLGLFYVLLAAAAVATLSSVPQYALWARGKDRALITIPIIGLAAAIVADVLLVPMVGMMGAAIGQLVAMVIMLLLRLAVLTADNRNRSHVTPA